MAIKPSFDYIAGMLDGSGSMRIEKFSRDGRIQFRSILTISNINRNIIERIQQRIGGRIFTYHKRGAAYPQDYILCVYGKNAAAVIEQLLSFLIVKEEHAKLFLQFAETLTEGRLPLSTTVLAKRERILEEFKKLN